MRHNPPNIGGVILFTVLSVGSPIDQPPQFDQIGEPERRPARGHRDERIRIDRIRPAHRQRELPAVPVEEEHPVLRPRLPNRQKHELPTGPRMKRVGHPNSSLITDGIERR